MASELRSTSKRSETPVEIRARMAADQVKFAATQTAIWAAFRVYLLAKGNTAASTDGLISKMQAAHGQPWSEQSNRAFDILANIEEQLAYGDTDYQAGNIIPTGRHHGRTTY